MSRPIVRSNLFFRLLVLSVFIFPILLQATIPVSADSDGLVPNLDIVLVIDESGSMMRPGTDQNDPGEGGHNGWRFVMADMFTQNWLGLDQSGAQHRVGVVLFGSDAVSVPGGLTPVSDGARLSSEIDRLHDDMNGTNYMRALEAAQQMLSTARPDAKKAIIFLSDGVCEDTSIMYSTEQCVVDVRGELTGIDVPIYTIAFTSSAFAQQGGYTYLTNLLEEMASNTGGLYFKAEKDKYNLMLQYDAIMRHLMGLPEGEPGESKSVPPEGMDVPFTIESNVFQVIVTVFKDEGVTEKLFMPDGTEVPCGNNASTGVLCRGNANAVSFSITNPAVGDWRVRLDGRGQAMIRKIIFPKNIIIKQADFQNPWPAGKPFETSFQIIDEKNEDMEVSNVSLTLTKPDGSIEPVELQKNSEQHYWIRYADTQMVGDYAFTITRQDQGDDISINYPFTVSVKNIPWLNVVQPNSSSEYPTNLPLDIYAQVMVGTDVYSPAPTDKVDIEVYVLNQADLGEMGHVFLEFGDNNTFKGQVSNLPMGDYFAAVTLNHTLASGESFMDSQQVNFIVGAAVDPTATTEPTATTIVTEAPTDTPVPADTKTPFPPKPEPTPTFCDLNPDAKECDKTPLILGIIGGIVALGAAAGGFFWYRGKPALTGNMDIGNGAMLPLSGKRPITIGSDPKSGVSLFGQGVAAKHATLRPTSGGVELTAVDPMNAPVKLNGTETSYAILQDGDTIEIGDQKLTYSTIQGFDAGPQNFDPGDSTGTYSF
jgi:hypothetical protein